jgi:hypothetical protein
LPHNLFSETKTASINPVYFALYKNISDGNITNPTTYKICKIKENNIIDIHLTSSTNGHYILIPDNYFIVRAYHFYNLNNAEKMRHRITDLFDKELNSTGTRIELYIPDNYLFN